MKRFLWLGLALFLLSGCGQAREIVVKVADNNLSDSYIYPYVIKINGKTGMPTSLIGCSEGVSTVSVAILDIPEPPRFILVEWEHLVTRKVYRAKIPLSDAGGRWWRRSPFREAGGKPRRPTLVVQWRGPKKVAAMLVADSLDFARASLDLGVAEGEEIPRPGWGPKLYITYKDLRRRPGGEYRIGGVRNYERQYDDTLSPRQRFGCPRLPDGRIDESRLPPQKLPYLVGANGEHIPCREYFCADRQELIDKLRPLGWRQYPPDSTPPAPVFGDAPNPRPAR